MSAPNVDAAQAQWQTQLAAMRAAISDLKLPLKSTTGETNYGTDIEFDEDEDVSSGNSGDDVWDFICESEGDAYSSDSPIEEVRHSTPNLNTSGYGPQWLKSRCIGFATRRQGLSSEDLQEQIMALLGSDSVEEELQSTLTDIVGFDDLDFVIELIAHRKEITAPSPFQQPKAEGLFGKLQTKRQREEALRQRDYEHKNAVLGPSIDRDGPKYPHVYKSHYAGNTLDSRGQKFGLPVGSEKTEHEVSTLIVASHCSALTKFSDMKNFPYPRQRLESLTTVASPFQNWMVSVGELSKATSS